MTDSTTSEITYFDVRGRAEVIRLILEETNTPYTEHRISLEQWPELKSELPFEQLPIYREGDLSLNQSNAIYRYLARKFDLYGDSMLQQVQCDMVQEAFVDAQFNLGGFFWDPDFESLRDNYEANELPALLTKLNGLFESNMTNSGFWVGSSLSFVDFIAWHFLDYVRAFSQRTLEQFPKLQEFKRGIESRPRISAYLDSARRPRTLTVAVAPFGGTPETS